MLCKCGKAFEINPGAGERSGKQARVYEIESETVNLIDSKKNRSLILTLMCPFCGCARAKLIRYSELLDLPDAGVIEALGEVVGGARHRGGNPVFDFWGSDAGGPTVDYKE